MLKRKLIVCRKKREGERKTEREKERDSVTVFVTIVSNTQQSRHIMQPLWSKSSHKKKILRLESNRGRRRRVSDFCASSAARKVGVLNRTDPRNRLHFKAKKTALIRFYSTVDAAAADASFEWIIQRSNISWKQMKSLKTNIPWPTDCIARKGNPREYLPVLLQAEVINKK